MTSGGTAARIDRVAALRGAPDGGAFALVVTWISGWHGTAGLAAMAAALALVLLWYCKARLGAAMVVLAMLGGGAVNSALKEGIARPRPDGALLSGGVEGFAFPSGHVMLSTVLYGLVLLCAASRWRHPLTRLCFAAGAFAMVALVAVGRVWSGAHHVSDVVAGVPAGVAWLSLLGAAVCLAVPRPTKDSSALPRHG